jgi:hypothetical protein
VLGAIDLGQVERRAFEWLAGRRVMHDTFGVVAADQTAVPHALWIKGDVRPEIALAKTRIAQQTCVWLVLQQLDQAPA